MKNYRLNGITVEATLLPSGLYEVIGAEGIIFECRASIFEYAYRPA